MARRSSAAIGFSQKVDPNAAVAQALKEALASGETPPVVALLFATITYDQKELLTALKKQLPGAPVVGCSTHGVTIPGKAVEGPRCLALAVLRSDDARARTAYATNLSADPAARGRELASKLGDPPQGQHITFIWYDPLKGANIAAMLEGLAEGGYPAVFGGGAGQPVGPRVGTFQYYEDTALSDSAVALTLEGFSVVADTTHGTEPIGLELTITEARDNVIVGIDDQPALDVCREQLGLDAVGDQDIMANWALGIKPPEGTTYEGMFTRGAFGVDEEQRTITLQAPLPVGSKVQVCTRTKEAVFDRALAMAERLRVALSGKKPILGLSFECAARPGPFLGTEMANREIVEMQRIVGDEIPWIGMYAWGELAPVSGRSEFHNYTFPLCILCES